MSFTPAGMLVWDKPLSKARCIGNSSFWVKILNGRGYRFRMQRNDGTGNMHMYWNSTGTGTPTAIGEGTAFRLTTNSTGAQTLLDYASVAAEPNVSTICITRLMVA